MGNNQPKSDKGKSVVSKDDISRVFTFPQGLEEELRDKFGRSTLARYSILSSCPLVLPGEEVESLVLELKQKLQDDRKNLTHKESRAIACMVFNAVGDALGAPLEFSAVRYGSTRLTDMGQKDVWMNDSFNRFSLKPGQWTDDAAMGLCIADSLILNNNDDKNQQPPTLDQKGKLLNPYDLRLRFLNWWEFGYNNAFGHDENRRWGQGSVGLGGNISSSMREFMYKQTPYTTAGNRKTSGNGSLMRNGAVPCRFWNDEKAAMEVGYSQSKTTHQGDEAAECCRLLSLICVKAINTEGAVDVAGLLESVAKEFKSDLYSVTCLANAKQEERHQVTDKFIPLSFVSCMSCIVHRASRACISPQHVLHRASCITPLTLLPFPYFVKQGK